MLNNILVNHLCISIPPKIDHSYIYQLNPLLIPMSTKKTFGPKVRLEGYGSQLGYSAIYEHDVILGEV